MDLATRASNLDRDLYKYIYDKGFNDALDVVRESLNGARWAAQEREFDNAQSFETTSASDYTTDYEYTYTTDYDYSPLDYTTDRSPDLSNLE